MLKSVIGKVFGTRHERERRRIQPIVDEINEHYERLHDVSEEELRGQTAKFRDIITGRTAELETRIAARGLDDRIHLVGHAEDMPAALLLADVVVHASTDPEAFGRTVIEAQAMRRPVIAADLGAPRETVEEAVTGWRISPGDPAALAQAIHWVLGLPEQERNAVGARARQAVLARYTTRAMQEATLAVYRELL
jgi:glycosyltransferase involved in cell wall biosynthesis